MKPNKNTLKTGVALAVAAGAAAAAHQVGKQTISQSEVRPVAIDPVTTQAFERAIDQKPRVAIAFHNALEGKPVTDRLPRTLSPQQVQLSLIKDIDTRKVKIRVMEDTNKIFSNHGANGSKVFTVTQKSHRPDVAIFPAGDTGENKGTGVEGPSTESGVGPAGQIANPDGFTASELGDTSLPGAGPLNLKASPFAATPTQAETGVDTGAGLPAVPSTSAGETISGSPEVPNGNPPMLPRPHERPHAPHNHVPPLLHGPSAVTGPGQNSGGETPGGTGMPPSTEQPPN